MNRLLKIFPALMCAGLTARCFCVVSAQDNSPSPAILVGTILNNPPYVMQKTASGIDLDIVRAAFLAAGYDVRFVHAPLARVEVLQETGKVDAMTTFRTREGLCTNSDVFSEWHDGVSVPAGSQHQVRELADLTGLRVGHFPGAEMVLEAVIGDYIDSFGSRLTIYSSPLAWKMLARNRVDAYIGDYWALEYAFRQEAGAEADLPFRVVLPFAPTERRLCVRTAAVLEAFNRGLAAIRRSGVHRQILLTYRPNRIHD